MKYGNKVKRLGFRISHLIDFAVLVALYAGTAVIVWLPLPGNAVDDIKIRFLEVSPIMIRWISLLALVFALSLLIILSFKYRIWSNHGDTEEWNRNYARWDLICAATSFFVIVPIIGMMIWMWQQQSPG